jgi:membrane-bound lytic murein transglycosylase B
MPSVRSLLALVLTLGATTAPPANAPLPHDGPGLRSAYARTTARLDGELDRWAGRGPLPRAAALDALYQERIVRFLASRPALARAVPAAASDVAARLDILRLTAPYPPATAVRIGPAAPPPALRRWYADAQHRFGVPWNLLAAVNFVESRFGRVRNASTAGAQGPMQFLPATWRAYGMGGDVDDPHDAILGAANYLYASGAPRSYKAALYAYNPSRLYVTAVLRYARAIRRSFRTLYVLHSWQVFVRTTHGLRRLTGPGPR